MERYLDPLLPILLDAALTLGIVTAVAGMAISLWLLLWPQGFIRFEERVSRHYSLRRALRPFDIARNVDRYIYRHHHAFGLFIILASTYTLYRLLFDIFPLAAADDPGLQVSRAILSWLLLSLDIFLLLGNLFAILIGLLIYTRPSLLKGFESRVNQWHSLRHKTDWLDARNNLPQRMTRTHPRAVALVLFVLCLYFLSVIKTVI